MYLAFYEYDGMTIYFGRASDGSTTACSLNPDIIRSALQKIEDELQPGNREYAALNAEPIQGFPRKEVGYENEAVDYVEGFVIVQMLGESPEFLIFSTASKPSFELVADAATLDNARYLAQNLLDGFGP
jgi:hypothetical protein